MPTSSSGPVLPTPPRATTRGWGWVVSAATLTALGMALRANLLVLFGCVLLLMAFLNLALASRQSRDLTGWRRIDGPRFAGGVCSVTIEVSNPSDDRIGLYLEDEGLKGPLNWEVPELKEGETYQVTGQMKLGRRGRRHWGAVWVGSAYPFGLVRRAYLLVLPEEVLVLPALGRLLRGRLRWLPGGPRVMERPRPRAALLSLSAQAELHALRDYRPGDSLRWIHWRSSARRGRLMVRQFEEPPGNGLLVVLDPCLPDVSPQSQAIFENAVSLTATLCWECARDVAWLGLLVAAPTPTILGGAPDRSHAIRLLEALAVVEAGPRTGVPAFQAALAVPPLGAVAVFLVTVGPSPLEALLRHKRRASVLALDPSGSPRRDFSDLAPSQEARE